MANSKNCKPQKATDAPAADIFEGYINEAELARQRGVSVRTCQRDRALRQAPPHVIVGRQVFYRIEAVREWLLGQEHRAAKPGTTRSRHRRSP